jgi:hypothetical protein
MSQGTLEALIAQLDQLGFYAYTERTHVAAAKARAEETGYLFDLVTNRAFCADSESLTEGGVIKFVEHIKPFLESQGVSILTIEQEFEIGGDYSVHLNGIAYMLYSKTELEDETNDLWSITVERTFAMLNTLLESAQSMERLYIYGGDNENQAVVLTEEQYETLRDNPLISTRNGPWPVKTTSY